MVETIRTDRLMLRPLRPSDAGPVTLHVSDPRLARMTTLIPHPYPPGAAEAFIEGTLKGRRDEEVWAIDATPIDGEELVGLVSYRPRGDELGYWVGPPYWNSGYASEAVAALVGHLFTAREIARLSAPVFADNAASAAVLGKLGFRQAGEVSLYSVARAAEVPSLLFRLERADWLARQTGGVDEVPR